MTPIPPLSAHQQPTGMVSRSSTLSNSAEGIFPQQPDLHVGEILRSAEAELDRAVAELGRASERAMADGDPQGARLYADRMYAAIRSRTPEHVARLEREALQRITESNSQ